MIENKLQDIECFILNDNEMKRAFSELKRRTYGSSNSTREALVIKASKSPGLKIQGQYVDGEIKRVFCMHNPDPNRNYCGLTKGKCIYLGQ